MKFKSVPEREFWEKIYVTVIRTGAETTIARIVADEALEDWRERLP